MHRYLFIYICMYEQLFICSIRSPRTTRSVVSLFWLVTTSIAVVVRAVLGSGLTNPNGPWAHLNTRCRIIIGTQKGTIILTTARLESPLLFLFLVFQKLYYRILINWLTKKWNYNGDYG